MTEVAAFVVLLLSVAAFAVLAGAGFGVGFLMLLSYGRPNGVELRRDLFGYFSPRWEVYDLFLVYFVMGLLTTFAGAVRVLGQALLPLLLITLLLLALRAIAYSMFHFGPPRWRGAATGLFAVGSVCAAAVLGYAAAASLSGYIRGETLSSNFYLSALGLTAALLALLASSHLAAIMLASYSSTRKSTTAGWFCSAATAAGCGSVGASILFTAVLTGKNNHLGDRLTGWPALPLVLAGALLIAGLVALRRSRHKLAVALTATGYATGLLVITLSDLPYLVYPTLKLDPAASAPNVLNAFLATTAVLAPLLVIALVIMHRVLGSGDKTTK